MGLAEMSNSSEGTALNEAGGMNVRNMSSLQRNYNQYKDHRTLAIASIICGVSCIGIVSLIYSVKAREINKSYRDPEDPDLRTRKAKEYSNKAFKLGIIAIVAWWSLLILLPLAMGLLSFLLTFIN